MPELPFSILIKAEGFPVEDMGKEISQQIEESLDEIAEEIEWSWRRHAANKLKESKDEYLNSLKVSRVGTTIEVSLNSKLAFYIENGSSAFDLKPGFLKGKLHRIIPMKNPLRFRTVSIRSSGWKHPGIKAREIHKDVMLDFEQEILPQVMDKLMSNIKI